MCGQSSPTQGSDVGPGFPIDGYLSLQVKGRGGREVKFRVIKGDGEGDQTETSVY